MHDVVGIKLEQLVRPERLINMVHQTYIGIFVKRTLGEQTGFPQQVFDVLVTGIGQGNGFYFFILFVIFFYKFRNNFIDSVIEFR